MSQVAAVARSALNDNIIRERAIFEPCRARKENRWSPVRSAFRCSVVQLRWVELRQIDVAR